MYSSHNYFYYFCIIFIIIPNNICSEVNGNTQEIQIVKQKVQRECGLPKNLSELPDFAQDEIKEIWRPYKPGNSCERELEIEEDIFDVIKSFNSEGANNSNKEQITTTSPVTHVEAATEQNHDYDQIASNGGTPIPLLSASTIASKSERSIPDHTDDDYLDQTTFDDVAMMQFDTPNAPFLKTASNDVKQEFEKIWANQDIPSENLRALKIQTLAVSLLTSKQLEEYNRWATKRRRVLKAREQEMRGLSFDARQTLRKMSSFKARDPGEQLVVPIQVKKELSTFVQKLNRRRNLKLVL